MLNRYSNLLVPSAEDENSLLRSDDERDILYLTFATIYNSFIKLLAADKWTKVSFNRNHKSLYYQLEELVIFNLAYSCIISFNTLIND